MARHASLAAGFARFFARPLVSRPFGMCGLATLAGNLALLLTVHRGESAILFCHTDLLYPLRTRPPKLTEVASRPRLRIPTRRDSHVRRPRAATDVPRKRRCCW